MPYDNKEMLYFQTSARKFCQGVVDASSSLFLPSEGMNLESSREFDSREKIEKDEWVVIDLSSKDEGNKIINTYRNAIDNSPNTLATDDYTKIKSIFKKENQEEEIQKILFQKIHASQRMASTFLTLTPGKLKISNIKGLTVQDNQTDAVLDFSKNLLYFQDFTKIAQIFKGIKAFYRIATTEEIEKFKAVKILLFPEDFEIKERNKKSIAHLIDNDFLKNTHAFEEWQAYAKKYKQIIEAVGGKFVISSNPELTTMLKVLLESFYTGEVTEQEKDAGL